MFYHWPLNNPLNNPIPHRFTSFPLNIPIPPNDGIIASLPIAFQVLSVMIFTCVSSYRTQSMLKSSIIASMHSFSLKIYDNLRCRWSFKVSFICSNTFSDSFLGFSIALVYGYALGFSFLMFILSILAIILGKSNASWSIALQQIQPGLLPGHALARCPSFL
jgi:hypothetical protein